MVRAFVLVGVLAFSAVSLSAEQAPHAQFGAHRPAQSNPYGRLFEARDLLKQAPQQAAHDAATKKTVCGMTIIEADPFFDQKMKVTPPMDPNVRYTIRALPPSVCGVPR